MKWEFCNLWHYNLIANESSRHVGSRRGKNMIKWCNFFMLFMEEGAIKITTWENSVLNMTERAFMLFKCNLLHGIPLLHTQLGYFQEREISFSKLISFCTAANFLPSQFAWQHFNSSCAFLVGHLSTRWSRHLQQCVSHATPLNICK